ncbi:phosphatidylserine/phosphatidylglycerophosphate/cardiolipin synthase family protein [Methylomonas koyamae]|uniref:phosphatidylserine/phosphatidylglycerophosphate/ cardiolipin synthase family protein n=1 Tax=Methylomonas koyamae TaxID=702114 RepID=UPI0011299C54|nr:phosphatidylserine/phosphatidylglycerophosphate/cardiolipin synthase family protein [Methylomonas koyamae]TPQ26063.1 hypothetical protein C2U68_13020 [Methylomonas koyamae]
MAIEPELLYRQLGRLIETMPDLTKSPVDNDTHLWLARGYSLVKETGNIADAALYSVKVNSIGTSFGANSAHEIKAIIYRAFAVAEMKAPAGARGAFIPVGNNFDAFSAISKVLQSSKIDVLIIDPYMDESTLTDFALAAPEKVNIRLLADMSDFKPSLEPAGKKWLQQYGSLRPLSIRLAAKKTLHDRAIFIDHTKVWTLTQSLKDFAKRSPAEIVRADDSAELKIRAYEDIWAVANEMILAP